MAQQKVQPTLLTFNSVLKSLRRCGGVGRTMSLFVLKEMEALDIGKRTKAFIICSDYDIPVPPQNRTVNVGVQHHTTCWRFPDSRGDVLHKPPKPVKAYSSTSLQKEAFDLDDDFFLTNK